MQINLEKNWLESALGQYLLALEKSFYDQKVTNLFGFNALQLGLLEIDLLQQSRMPKCIHSTQYAGHVLSESEYLPFAESCIDLVCMPHTLEFCQNPHQTLREVERVMVPEGHVIITGLNPISSWGLRRKLSRHQEYPWCGESLSAGRVKDWLALLGFETMHSGHFAYIVPINDKRWIARQQWLESASQKFCPLTGGIYFIIAKKRVVNMTLLKPNWKKGISASALIPKPTKVNAPKTNSHNKININQHDE